MKSKLLFFEIVVLSVTLALIINVVGSFAIQVSSTTPYYAEQVIVIDAGHGDFDPGKVASDGTREKDINLSIALKLYDIFTANGYTAVLTRSDDTTLADKSATSVSTKKKTDTHNRVKYADSFTDSVLISIHQNSYTESSSHGTQLFYGTKNDESKLLAEAIMGSVVDKIQPENTCPLKEGTSSIYILVNTKAPTVLVECGFMTNSEELKKLKDEEYQRRMAFSIFLGYLDYKAYIKSE